MKATQKKRTDFEELRIKQEIIEARLMKHSKLLKYYSPPKKRVVSRKKREDSS